MRYIKVCMDCGLEFESDKLYDETLTCAKCGSGDIVQPIELDYSEVTLQECIDLYRRHDIAIEFDADHSEVDFRQE